MVTSDLGQCEWFVWDLRKSGLIERGQLDQLVNDFLRKNPRAEAPALADHLTGQGTLTPFQAERVLNGKTQGLVLNQYILLDAIGQGSMGQVFKSVSKNDNAVYALKVLPRRSMWNVRLARRQVRSFSSFQHAAVVPFVDVGTAGGLHYLAWPLVEGHTLESILHQEGKLPPGQAANIAAQVAQGLACAHQNNIFHGLLKPSNIMVASDGQARILDFGIGTLLVENEGESLVDTMSTANTLTSGLDFASPECIMEPSNRTPAGDQYSLGCILYCTLTGRAPFPDGSAVEKMMAHQAKEPTPIKDFAPETPDGLIAVVEKLMAKKPEDRFGGCDQVVDALTPFMSKSLPTSSAAKASSHRMPGLSSLSSKGGGLGSNRGVAAATPVPAGGISRFAVQEQMETPNPASQPTGNNIRKSTAGLPSRTAFQLGGPPQQDQRPVTLTPAANSSPVAASSPIKVSAFGNPDGWIPGNDAAPEQSFGTVGIIAATLLITVLVYFGVLKLMQ
ncbi:MAG TPA: serine/threonine-protein kinase [Fimbriiglobus sp.]|jgi:serine/threonine-protein kinase